MTTGNILKDRWRLLESFSRPTSSVVNMTCYQLSINDEVVIYSVRHFRCTHSPIHGNISIVGNCYRHFLLPSWFSRPVQRICESSIWHHWLPNRSRDLRSLESGGGPGESLRGGTARRSASVSVTAQLCVCVRVCSPSSHTCHPSCLPPHALSCCFFILPELRQRSQHQENVPRRNNINVPVLSSRMCSIIFPHKMT